MVSKTNFPSWVNQIEKLQYSRRWPDWCNKVINKTTAVWNGVEGDDKENEGRREAYDWMEQSVPAKLKYLLMGVRIGDPQQLYIYRSLESILSSNPR